MKVIGGMMAFAACGMIGFLRVCAARRRIDTLNALCDALALMKSELAAHLTPLPALCGYMTRQSSAGARSFFSALEERMPLMKQGSFSELWRDSALAALPELERDELTELLSLGMILGRSDLDTQLEAIEHCRIMLQGALRCARDTLPQTKKLSLGLAAAAGLMLVIMLI